LSRTERDRLKADFASQAAGGRHSRGLAANLGHVITLLEPAGFYAVSTTSRGVLQKGLQIYLSFPLLQSDPDVTCDDLSICLDLKTLESSAQELVMPFLRIASLIRHYVFTEDMPKVLFLVVQCSFCCAKSIYS
jgi:hypothetical protein